jgi:hypothetical protein
MIEITESLEEESGIDLYEEMESLIKTSPWAWQSVGSILGLVGGVLSPVLGTLLIAVAWLIDSPEFSTLHILCMGLFAVTIPLLVGGAHCLDLLEGKTADFSVREREPEKSVPQSLPYKAKAEELSEFQSSPRANDGGDFSHEVSHRRMRVARI